MKTYRVTYSKGGLEDIAALATSTSQHFVDSILEVCESLATFPRRGTLRADIRPNMRLIGYQRKAGILFRIDESKNLVVILGVTYRGQLVNPVLERNE